jgi:hypothetical protein
LAKATIEAFHARSVLEAASEDTFLDRNAAVESGEVAETTLLTASPFDYLIYMFEDFVDRTGRHGNVRSCLVEYTELGELMPSGTG